jgi:2-methylcitrate dehydratase PrpD
VSISEQLAAFVADADVSAIPAPVVRRAKLHLLDTLGVALASSGMDFGRAICAAARELGGEPRASLIGGRARTGAAWAALANGTLAHGLDYDDTHLESVVHVSAGVAPAVLAAAEDAGAGGRAALTALVLGMETAVRVGLAAPGRFHDRGYHPTGVCNAFAAALVAGRLSGLSAKRLAHALGIAGSQAAGLMEFLTDGADVKRLHPGWAAHAGLVAAQLARHGFTGPRAVFEGRFGLYRSHLGDDDWNAAALTGGLGEHWHCLEISMKPYPCCHYNHALIDAVALLQRTHRFTVDEVAAVECLLSERQFPVVCEPVASKRRPQTDYDAKFSVPYAVASMLVRGHVDVDDFTPDAVRAPAVLAVAERVTHLPDPDTDYPKHYGGAVRVRLRDGRLLEQREAINRGCAERPLSDEEVRDKFRRNAGRVLPPAAVAAVIDAVEGLDAAPSLDTLTAALRGAATGK